MHIHRLFSIHQLVVHIMTHHRFWLVLALLGALSLCAQAQVVSRSVADIRVSATTAVFLGKTAPVRELAPKPATSPAKKQALRRLKSVPDNFRGRAIGGKAVHPALEHQGPDPLRQTAFPAAFSGSDAEVLVNVPGQGGFGSPHDPSGDVSDEYYVQAINVTFVGVYDLEGNLIQQFPMNTLWAELGESSAGDPIVLYDEQARKWFITEFTDPANLLIAVSETSDPLGSYYAYSFATPSFPDYPKYGITPKALVVTTNEGGPGVLHQYFLDIEALRAGAEEVAMLRVEAPGSNGTESGFYVTTPADWNGLNLPFDNRPITLCLNDSSWPGGPAQDQLELYAFNLDFDNPDNTSVEQTSIVVSPFDSYPCSAEGFGFACAPQLQGSGLDAIPELVMNVPHLRNFGTHESLVLTFITDLTAGDNVSGIRWMELRRTADTDWALYQEGTVGPEDGFDRFMSSIAIDSKGNIGLAYNISSAESYVGIRLTGRRVSDPLGVMTAPEVVVIDGASTISSGGRFGDYPQMSVSPLGDNTFWFTTEYAAEDDSGTRIVAFKLSKDTFDLAARAILNPQTTNALGAAEQVTGQFFNAGLTPLANFQLGLLVNGELLELTAIADTLQVDSFLIYAFDTPVDMSALGDYGLGIFISHPDDQNRLNDTLRTTVTKLIDLNGTLAGGLAGISGCEGSASALLTLGSLGGEVISEAVIEVVVNGVVIDSIQYEGSLAYNQSDDFAYAFSEGLQAGNNSIVFQIVSVNGVADGVAGDNAIALSYNLLSGGQFVTLVFNTDDYPEESSWSITDASSGVAIAGGAFEEGSTTYSLQICLPTDSCYVIRVEDTFGDGICCGFGEGNFSVLDSVGNVLLFNDGNFGNVAIEEFCPRGGCFLAAEISAEDAGTAAAADGIILISASNGIAPYAYSIDGGATFQESPLFENLAPGQYEVVVASANSTCIYTETVTISFTTATQTVNGQSVKVTLLPNPTDGVFRLVVADLPTRDAQLNVQIFNLNGQLLQNRAIGRFDNDFVGTFSLYDYPAGHYFVRIVAEGVTLLERVVRTK